jgi:hypothetical protein
VTVVYSARLILISSLSSITDLLTCPDGYVTVINTVDWTTGVNAGQAWASLVHVSTGARFAAVQTAVEGSTDYFSQTIEGRWVFSAGEVIAGETDGVSEWDCFASGYLLTLP